ncbi:MAG: substrate-binding domain-containing protein [Microthrixaceae bacterium]|jgi:D-xylose transport system substrate-binding protein
MRKLIRVAVTVLAAGSLVLAACGDDSDDKGSGDTSGGDSGGTKIGVILPDSKSSARWETADRKFLDEAIAGAGFEAVIQNAEGDKQKMATIADSMIAQGVKVLMIVNLDSESGATILKKAKDAGIKTIDYDRLTLGGGADVYISFDNVAVGKLQGEGLTKCLDEKGTAKPKVAVLNGSPTDNNATLFKEGYDGVINKKFDSGEWTEVDDQSVPDWDNQKGGQIFEQMLATAGGSVDGVLAANDGLGGAAIAVLQKNGLKVPVTGQDATVEGLRNILTGDQCMTVYKAIKVEADAAADAAIALASGEEPDTNGEVEDTETGKMVESVLATPVAIFKDNVKDVIADGFVAQDEVCEGLEAECADAGIE